MLVHVKAWSWYRHHSYGFIHTWNMYGLQFSFCWGVSKQSGALQLVMWL